MIKKTTSIAIALTVLGSFGCQSTKPEQVPPAQSAPKSPTAKDWKECAMTIENAAAPAATPNPDPYANETKEERDARMAWWRDARFGLFIHWGVYAVPAGIHNGKPVDGYGEWIMEKGKIPVEEYKAYAAQFNPTKYDPEAWVLLAKKAGMKYIVITAKHHDGFALWPSAVNDWNIGSTPYKKTSSSPWPKPARSTASSLASTIRRPWTGTTVAPVRRIPTTNARWMNMWNR